MYVFVQLKELLKRVALNEEALKTPELTVRVVPQYTTSVIWFECSVFSVYVQVESLHVVHV